MAVSRCNRVMMGCLASSMVLLGCGAQPQSVKAPRRPVAVTPPPAAAPQPAPAADVSVLLAGIRRAKQTVTGFTGQVDTFEDGPKGKVNESLSIAFRKPSTLKIEVTKSDGGNKGTQLLWSGGDECKVKPSYLPFAVKLKMSDDRLLSKNGWEIRETEVNSILKVLLDPQTRLTPTGEQTVGAKRLVMLDVTSPATPKGGTREVIGIDPAISLPGVRMIFKGDKLIYKLTINRLTLKQPTESQLDL